jgi:ribosomal protein S18 acetylase RimI-like enzyme
MNVTLSCNEYKPDKLYEMFRVAMERHVNSTRGKLWNDHRERIQFFEQLTPNSVQLICVDDQVVGFVDLRTEAGNLNIHTMIVLPEGQSKGIGSIVLDRLKVDAERLNRRITLSVLKTNPRARDFYERNGFREISSAIHHHQMVWTYNPRV